MMSVEIEQLQYQAGGHAILSDVSLRARQGEHVAILGANGSGKSTLLRLIAGLAVPASGQIRIHDQVCSDAGRCVVPPARRDVAMMFQDHGLWPHLTVRQNVELGSRYKHASRVEWRGAVDAAIEQCDLSMLCHRKARDLSGGEQQRVAMARALATQARILLLDEPLSALDAIQSLAVARLVRAVASSGRTTILSIAHRPDDVWALAPGRIVVLEDGRLIEEPALARPESSASRESGLPRSAFLKQWLAAKEAGADQQACHGASCPISTDP